MQNKINKLNDIYKYEIRSFLNKVCPAGQLSPETPLDFGSILSDTFNIPDMKDYDEYIDILDKIEIYDSRLALRLERYLIKELNLISLLAFHAACSSGRKVPLRLEENF